MGRKRKDNSQCGAGMNIVKRRRLSKAHVTSDDTKSKNSVQHAMGIEVILREILQNFDTNELLKLRRVSNKWNDVIVTTLIKRKSCALVFDRGFLKRVKPKQSTISTQNTSSSKVRFGKRSLEHNIAALSDCIANSRKFPCTVVAIGPGSWNLEDEIFHNCLKACGSGIKVLELNMDLMQTTAALQKLVLETLPSIEYIIIKAINVTSSSASTGVPVRIFPRGARRYCLPALTDIRCDRAIDSLAFQDILQAGVNVKRVTMVCSSELLDVLVHSGKASTLAELSIAPVLSQDSQLFDINCFMNLASLRPQLNKLTIFFHPRIRRSDQLPVVLKNALSIIIASSSEKMKCLNLRAISFVSHINPIPEMSSLELLCLGDGPKPFTKCFEEHQPVFHADVHVASTFPHLERVEVRIHLVNWGLVFNSTQSFLSVRTLQVAMDVQTLDLRCMYRNFPNVTHVIFTDFCVRHPLNNSVWLLPASVTSVEIRELRFSSQLNNADSFFTGFHEVTCQKMLLSKPDSTQADSDLFRIYPSIVHAPNLKTLKMGFNHYLNGRAILKHYFATSRFISEVSGLYAFSKMPQLNVIFAYNFTGPHAKDIANILEPLRPFVTFYHEDMQVRQ